MDIPVIKEVLKKGYIFEKSALEFLKKEDIDRRQLEEFLLNINEKIITKEALESFLKREKPIVIEKKVIRPAKDTESKVELIERKKEENGRDLDTLYHMFLSKYEKLRKIIQGRRDATNAISINNLTKLRIMNEDVVLIAMVKEKHTTKNGNVILDLEDNTGEIRGFISKESGIDTENIILDDVIGLKGRLNNNFFFINEVIYPDIPFPDKVNTITEDLNAVFISDLHYGSKNFIEKIEYKFLEWLKSDDKDAIKVKHIFIAGDIVDGVGIYASQKDDLELADVYEQYERFESFVEQIPDYINVCVIPGNHDAVRSSEPQPPLDKKLVPKLYDFKNVFFGENPSIFKIHGQDGSKGINVLMYHGYSFTSLANEIPHLRRKGISEPQHIMKDVLRRRHLAPFYGSTLQAPEKEDFLVIDTIPDIFHTGDLHSHAIDNYKGVTLISSSTWQAQTAFQDRVGHKANPGKISIVNLKTRKAWYLDYYSK